MVNYIDLLEKSFVVLRLYPYSRNPRREISKQSKIYFLDLGIRNALIGDFNDPVIRSDQGVLWENFLIIERQKTLFNQGQFVQRAFGGHIAVPSWITMKKLVLARSTLAS